MRRPTKWVTSNKVRRPKNEIKSGEKKETEILQSKKIKAERRHNQNYKILDFPGGTVVKNLPANAGDMGSSPGPGRSHMPRSN